jgi:hypothetical protein
MTCVANAFDDADIIYHDDSEALLFVTSKLSDMFINGIESPVNKDEPLLFPKESMSKDEQDVIIQSVQQLYIKLNEALNNSIMAKEVISKMRLIFGDRIEMNVNLIISNVEKNIKNAQPKLQPQKFIGETKSG